MEHRKQHHALIAVAVGLLSLGSGCMTGDANKSASKKPDVTQPGVLPPPQETMKPASAVAPGGGVIPAGGVPTGAGQKGVIAPELQPTMTTASSSSSPLSKLMAKTERKIPATEMAVAWRNRIAYLPDPSRNGAMGAGIAGQLFLYGGPNLQFALADGTLTVDLVDETPRPAGQPAARPERWQFDKNTLRNLRTVDETFGKSYVLFLPWPGYRADITRVKISARYDPDNGHTLYATPSALTIDTSGPLGTQVFDGMSNTIKPIGGLTGGGPQPFTGLPSGPSPALQPLNPIPLGKGSHDGGMQPRNNMPAAGDIPLGGSMPAGSGPFVTNPPALTGPAPVIPPAPMMPMPPAGGLPSGAAPPTGAMPAAPLPPIGLTIPPPSR